MKEQLVIAETDLEATRLETQQWKEKHQVARKEAKLLKNTSGRLRIKQRSLNLHVDNGDTKNHIPQPHWFLIHIMNQIYIW
jgi:hypothetical protein